MSDFHAYIPYVNRPDLLIKAAESLYDLRPHLTILDNSAQEDEKVFFPIPADVPVIRPTVPLTAVQSINFFLTDAKRRGCKFMLWGHNDHEAHPGSALALVEYARKMFAEGRKWGICFTAYDALSATNLDVIDDVGLWDSTLFSGYHGDNDFYRRLRLAGYETIDTNIPVDHVGSQTIKSDPEREFMNSILFPISGFLYERKWGGRPGEETFSTPFGR